MNNYELYQLDISDLEFELGTGYMYEMFRDLRCSGSKAWKPEYLLHFKCVGWAKCDTLEDVFTLFNDYPTGNDEHDYQRTRRSSSASVGDLIMDENEDFYMIDGMGFTKVDLPVRKSFWINE